MSALRPLQRSIRQALPEVEFPSCYVRDLIKEQDNEEHLKETAANQTKHTQHTPAG